MYQHRRLSDVLKRKKPPKRSLGRKGRNAAEDLPTDLANKGTPTTSRGSSRTKAASNFFFKSICISTSHSRCCILINSICNYLKYDKELTH